MISKRGWFVLKEVVTGYMSTRALELYKNCVCVCVCVFSLKVSEPPKLLRTIKWISNTNVHRNDFLEVISLGLSGFPNHHFFKFILNNKNRGHMPIPSLSVSE